MAIGAALQDFGGAVSDLFGAKGSDASAQSYAGAAAIAGQNEQIAGEATKIQETQESRQIYQTIGTQKAQVGGAGFASSGTALDLLRSSASQGALVKAQTAAQGAITENSYAEQQGFYSGMQGAAQASSKGSSIGGIIQGVGGAIEIASSIFGGSGGGSSGGSGGSIIGTVATVAEAVSSWVVCTELNKQGRLSNRWYMTGATRFVLYDERIKQGYYLWAIPAVLHLRKSPDSLLSNSLCWIFNHRAEYIAAQAGIRGARKTIAGWLTLAGVHGFCWLLSRTIARKPIDWMILNNA